MNYADNDEQYYKHLEALTSEELLRKLLATIHRDRGNHTERVGLVQSTHEAMNKVVSKQELARKLSMELAEIKTTLYNIVHNPEQK